MLPRSVEFPMRTNEVPMLVGGLWESGRSGRSGEVFNPSTGRAIARVPLCSAEEAGWAVEAASRALPDWAETPAFERARVLFRFRERLAAEAEGLARLVTREHGKTLSESRASVQRGLEMVEFACGIPSLLMGQTLPNIAREVDCETVRHPVGVCVGITPFNFPVMVPLWMVPVALACGNTFVLKPSEKVPLSAVRLGELLVEAGLPDGVFNIVHGDKECVDALLEHPLVAAISFVGSTAVARHVYETGTRNGKRVQAAGGAKNHLIMMPDADLEQAAKAVLASAFGCAGERCMAGSLALPVGGIADRLVERVATWPARCASGRPIRDRRWTWGRSSAGTIATGWPATWRPGVPRARNSHSTVGWDLRRRFPDRPERRWTASSRGCGSPARRSSGRCCRSSASATSKRPWPSAGTVRMATGPRSSRGRPGRPAVQAQVQRRDDRHQCRRAGPDGLVPVHRLEPILLRRLAHPGVRRRAILYAAENDHDAMVRVG